jgi:hypothetical protein
MIWIERISIRVAAFDALGRERFALLFDDASLPVVTRRATRQNVVQRRVRIAALADWNYVVDRDRGG